MWAPYLIAAMLPSIKQSIIIGRNVFMSNKRNYHRYIMILVSLLYINAKPTVCSLMTKL